MAPKVSVLIPTYNYGRYLSEAIESVLSQSYADFELLIIDDHSSDDTAEVVSRYAREDKRISFRINGGNIGMVENWNLCLREAKGEYVKYLFGDDLLCSKDAISLMVEALDVDPGVSLVASARKIIDSAGRRIAIWTHFPDSGYIDGRQVINRCLRDQKNLVGEPTAVMFRKRLSAEGFDPGFRQIVDMEFWFRLLERGGFAFINQPLVAFRSHDAQQTRVNRGNAPLILDDTARLLREYVLNEDKKYVDLSRFRKIYLVYDNNYQVWKLYRQGVVKRSEARGRIAAGYGWGRFLLGYPLYKIFKPFNKLLFRIGNRGWFSSRPVRE
ncbi:MAG: glycosyltransferase [Syntrophobacteraceae bacterium]|nr:glycosyltransferase [Syntrophobacteraceae bacterium]